MNEGADQQPPLGDVDRCAKCSGRALCCRRRDLTSKQGIGAKVMPLRRDDADG